MKINVLIIGFGSIGQRHAKILNNFKNVNDIYILSRQKNIPYKRISKIENINKINFHYAIIASPTSHHYKHLSYLETNFNNKLILVEKPLFSKFQKLKIKKNKVYIGYNLRFHPIIRLVSKHIKNKKIYHTNIYCSSFLPAWRPKREYSLTSSASKKLGGGVLLDLSHELDYARIFFGNINIDFSQQKRLSKLKINTSDFITIIGKTNLCKNIIITLNYFSKIPSREIKIDGYNFSLKADLIHNTLTVINNGKVKSHSYKKLERNYTYIEQHKSLLKNIFTHVCTYKEGLELLKMINPIL